MPSLTEFIVIAIFAWFVLRVGKVIYEILPHVSTKRTERNIAQFARFLSSSVDSEKERGVEALESLRNAYLLSVQHTQNALQTIETALKNGTSLDELGLTPGELDELRQGSAVRYKARLYVNELRAKIERSQQSVERFTCQDYESFEAVEWLVNDLMAHVRVGEFELQAIGSSREEIENIQQTAHIGLVCIGLQELKASKPNTIRLYNPDYWCQFIRKQAEQLSEDAIPQSVKTDLLGMDQLCEEAWMREACRLREKLKQPPVTLSTLWNFNKVLVRLGRSPEQFGVRSSELDDWEKEGHLQNARNAVDSLRESRAKYFKAFGRLLMHALFGTEPDLSRSVLRYIRFDGQDELWRLKDILRKADAKPSQVNVNFLELKMFELLFRSRKTTSND